MPNKSKPGQVSHGVQDVLAATMDALMSSPKQDTVEWLVEAQRHLQSYERLKKQGRLSPTLADKARQLGTAVTESLIRLMRRDQDLASHLKRLGQESPRIAEALQRPLAPGSDDLSYMLAMLQMRCHERCRKTLGVRPKKQHPSRAEQQLAEQRLKRTREQLRDLPLVVAVTEYRDAYRGGPQPRSQFRRFRN